MIHKNDFNFTVNPVENVDIHKEFEVGGHKYTIAQLREALPLQEKRFNCLIDWDDMCQYTAIGLFEVLKEHFGGEQEFNVLDFLSRRDYPNGKEYVKKILFPKLPGKTVDMVFHAKYPEICQRSPKTHFFSRMFLAKLLYQSITFVFPFEVDGLGEMVKDIQNEMFTNKSECDYIVLRNDNDKHEYYKAGTHDIYVVSDGGLCYRSLFDTDRKDKLIITPDNHHGITDMVLGLYYLFVEKHELRSPNDIVLQILAEVNEVSLPDKEDDVIYFENGGQR